MAKIPICCDFQPVLFMVSLIAYIGWATGEIPPTIVPVHHDGSIESTPLYSANNTDEDSLPTVAAPQYNFSDEFLKCIEQQKAVILDSGEFVLLSNGSVHVPDYNRMYDSGDYYYNPEKKDLSVCPPPFLPNDCESCDNPEINSKVSYGVLTVVSLIGLSISILALVLHLVAFMMVSDIRNLPGYCLASMSIALLIGYLCFVCIPAATSWTCPQLAVVMYYFFLSSFFWMSIIAYDVFRTLRLATKRLRLSSNRVPWKRFFVYSLYSWLVPLAIVLSAVLLDKYPTGSEDYKPKFDKSPICWFYGKRALFMFFALPLIVIMVSNTVLFTVSGIIIHRASMKNNQDGGLVLRRRFLMFLKLAVIMGLGWIFGIIAGYARVLVLWYVFVIINTLQGLFIFLGFSLTGKVRSNLRSKFFRKSSPTSSVLSNQTVTQISTSFSAA